MALCEIRFKSSSLRKSESMYAVVPDGKGPFSVLYLLHGLSDDYTMWQRRTSIERHAEGLPFIVVMPDGGRSFYCNHTGGEQYEDHIVRDVVGTVDCMFHTKRSRKNRAIAGLSMGGYGAIMLALRHPDIFSAAASHSGALFFGHERLSGRQHDKVNRQWRDLPRGKYDCYRLAAKLARRGRTPAIRIDCGKDDFLIRHNRNFAAHLSRLGIKHTYEEFPGAHTWAYWDEHIVQTLAFAKSRLRV